MFQRIATHGFGSAPASRSGRLDRRTLLKGAGVSMAIPWLSAMDRTFAAPGTSAASSSPQRFVSMTLGLGLLGDNLNPDQAGSDYKASAYLEAIEDLRKDFTVISGSSHPEVTGGHRAEASLLTGNPLASSGAGKNSISLDQLMAKYLGNHTRFPSLVLSSAGSTSPSYTETGAMIPALNSPSRLYTQLFVEDSPEVQEQQLQRIQQGRSIMDLVNEDAKRLTRTLGAADRERLEQYFSSVRDLEHRLAESEAWTHRPKPEVEADRPTDIANGNDFIGRQELMSQMIRLALQTDSTRFITYHLGGSGGVLPIKGVNQGYHALSHHGKDKTKLKELALIEMQIVASWGQFLRDLKSIEEEDGTLLDHTSILLTSNLGNASNHDNRNMPVLLGGGGFRHGQHLAFDARQNYPLTNLFVSLLQRVGLERDRFASGTGTMRGLEMTS